MQTGHVDIQNISCRITYVPDCAKTTECATIRAYSQHIFRQYEQQDKLIVFPPKSYLHLH
jgi:hypothetical protein